MHYNHLPNITCLTEQRITSEAVVPRVCANIRPNHLNPPKFSACSKDGMLQTSATRLNSELLRKFIQFIPPILWRQRRSNTKSLRISSAPSGHVFELQSNTNFTGAVYIQPLIGNRMSCRLHRWLGLVHTNPAPWVRKETSSDMRPSGEIQPPTAGCQAETTNPLHW